ncbi:hyaluronan and proteoglycan link protein 3-like isoform X2 [Xyrauchen texanus]|uniref:hyaluronan and proteoglycan link protein 3-like isoform X2 n=1 Tax=Xyrauchen texanus TaxID=154827 RepID=UPI0022429596|nr:hyaluronan and proteoglycan link protein 3-like isoform X2 [Xyrauchen texanus]
MWILRHLLVFLMHLLLGSFAERFSNGYYYQDIVNGNDNYGEMYYHRIRLYVESPQTLVSAVQGSNATLPCYYRYEPKLSPTRRARVKWFWLPINGDGQERDVMVAIGAHYRSYGDFKGRVRLRRGAPGVVFPYYSHRGRYLMNFHEAEEACKNQDSHLATFEQLFAAWEEGLDWCNAGWLADGTAQYPVSVPREACGGSDLAPGVRSFGFRDKSLDQFDAFCFTSSIRGEVYFLQHPIKLNFTEAAEACHNDGGHIAKVGQLYAAWRFVGLDQCDAGWLADGSVRYPIIKPRMNCGPSEPGVRSFGFPPKHLKHGVYCYKVHW